TLESTSGSDAVVGFAVLSGSERLGTVALVAHDAPGRKGPREGTVRWNFHDDTHAFTQGRAIDLAIRHAFEELAWVRVEARVEDTDPESVRAGQLAGMRKEGVARYAT